MKDTSNKVIDTILSIVFIDIANPKIGYYVYHNNAIAKIKYIMNQRVTLEGIYNNDISYTNIHNIKNKYIKFLSIHSKITHSINHISNSKILKVISDFAGYGGVFSPDDIIADIICNNVTVAIKGTIVPVYVYPNIDSEVCIISTQVMKDFELVTDTDKLAKLSDIHRNGKVTIYTIITTNGTHIMCDRSDFKLVGLLDRKDLFSIL